MPRSRSYQTKLIEALRDQQEAAAYLSAALEETDRELFLLALRNVAEAQGGLARLADATQLNRENLYRMLSDKGNPEFYSLITLLDALGFQLAVEAIVPKRAAAQQGKGKILVFRTRNVPTTPTANRFALAADTKGKYAAETVLITEGGKEIGSLGYDYEKAELYLKFWRSVPDWTAIDVEIQTKDGNRVRSTASREEGEKLILLQQTPITKDLVEQIVLTVSEKETKS